MTGVKGEGIIAEEMTQWYMLAINKYTEYTKQTTVH